MPFPETTTELVNAGYRFDNGANCRGCGASVEWWITPKGKRMPMDVDADGNCEPHWSTCPNAKEFRK
jgi:hypothetical protein